MQSGISQASVTKWTRNSLPSKKFRHLRISLWPPILPFSLLFGSFKWFRFWDRSKLDLFRFSNNQPPLLHCCLSQSRHSSSLDSALGWKNPFNSCQSLNWIDKTLNRHNIVGWTTHKGGSPADKWWSTCSWRVSGVLPSFNSCTHHTETLVFGDDTFRTTLSFCLETRFGVLFSRVFTWLFTRASQSWLLFSHSSFCVILFCASSRWGNKNQSFYSGWTGWISLDLELQARWRQFGDHILLLTFPLFVGLVRVNQSNQGSFS